MLTLLSTIIDSEAQTDILAYFLATTKRAFFRAELQTIINQPKSAIDTALLSLTHHQLLSKQIINVAILYSLNNKSGLVQNLLTSFVKTYKPQVSSYDPFVAGLKACGTLQFIVFSGIFMGLKKSPADILLIGKVNSEKLKEFVNKFETLVGVELRYSVMELKEFNDRKDTFDKFTRDIFDYPNCLVKIE